MITKLTKVFGKEVYTLSGSRVGRVEDVTIDVDTRKLSEVLISNLDPAFQKRYELEDAKGVILPYSGIRAVHDIVLVNNIKYRLHGTEAAAQAQEGSEEGLL